MTPRTETVQDGGTRRCPRCAEQLTAVGTFWICPIHGQIPNTEPSSSLRIFLSYGHDANEELVRNIKADLEKRGHDVWYDKSEIKFGDDWRRAITDGIVGSNRVLSFLSKHSTRDPGVCLDEIAIAIGVKGGNIQTILVEAEAEVRPPASISYIQWLDMHDWKERRAAGEAAWEEWYQAKLAEIVRVVESDESRRFAGEIETLNRHLKPISSESRLATLLQKGFVGRIWLIEAIEQWRNAPDQASRLFLITGDPGVGKSAFAAHLTHFGRDKVVAAQFVEWDKPDHRNAQRVVRSLAFQLATRLPDYRKLLLTLAEIADLDRKGAAELFDYLLTNPLRSVIHGGRERYLIVIDALDEAGDAQRNPLVDMLARDAQRLPPWLCIVVTSRPESAVKTPLQGLNPFTLDTQTEANRADIREFLHHKLAPQLRDRPDANRLVEQILEKSEGVFLYVERFCDDVQHNHVSLDRSEQFPQGLGGIFFQFFQRQFPDLQEFQAVILPALRMIVAAPQAIPIAIVQRILHWQDEQVRDVCRSLGSLFRLTTQSGSSWWEDRGKHEVIRPYHKSVVDWLADHRRSGVFFVSPTEGHRLLASVGWSDYVKKEGHLGYWLDALPAHLLGAWPWKTLEVATHKTDIRCLAFSGDGSLLASGDDAGAIGVCSTASGRGRIIGAHTHFVLSVLFSGDLESPEISSICFAGETRRWDAATGILKSAEGGFEDMRCMAVSHDNGTLGHLASGVWCGYRGPSKHGETVFGMWAQSDGPMLRIYAPRIA